MNVILVIDTSHSVLQYVTPYLQTINTIIEIQKKINPENLLSVVTFSNRIDYLCLNKPVKNITSPISVQDLNIQGNTALYDSVVAILGNLHKFHDKTKMRTETQVIILTDGLDTCSRFTQPKHLAFQIAKSQALGWKFTFLGTTEDSMNLGRILGCNVCVLYNTIESSFNRIGNVVEDLLQARIPSNVDVDLRDLTEAMSDMKLN